MQKKSHPQFPFLIIHEDGRVFSENTKDFLKQNFYNGYFTVSFYIEKKHHTLRAHRLVAETFLDNPYNKSLVRHKDGNKKNNIVSNLEWCSSYEITKQACDEGKFKAKSGEECPKSKLSYEIVDYMRKVYKPKDSVYGISGLADFFGVHRRTVSNIVNNKTWINE
jgi:hypothetical protein